MTTSQPEESAPSSGVGVEAGANIPAAPGAVVAPAPEEIEIGNVEDWREPPIVTFGEQASLQIAQWVLFVFGGAFLLCFIMGFIMMWFADATHDASLEFIKFMIGSILPLVTLAVGYYLGDKGRHNS